MYDKATHVGRLFLRPNQLRILILLENGFELLFREGMQLFNSNNGGVFYFLLLLRLRPNRNIFCRNKARHGLPSLAETDGSSNTS